MLVNRWSRPHSFVAALRRRSYCTELYTTICNSKEPVMLALLIFFVLGIALGAIGLRLLAMWESHSRNNPHTDWLHRHR
jgi:hypothetical protein